MIEIGLDFGTSNSGAAVFDGQQVRILPLDRRSLLPQVVKTILYLPRSHQPLIGQEAIETYYRHNVNRPRRFVRQWVGELEFRGADMFYVRDLYTQVDELMPGRLLQYLKTALRSGYAGTQVFDRYYSLKELIAIYLGLLKQRAEQELGETIGGVMLGRPVRFCEQDGPDQQAEETLRQAAEQAGFERVRFELEPVAAARFYERSLSQPKTALIFDFGGGTLDMTILRLGDRNDRRVFASRGVGIAGSDFDQAIIQRRMAPLFGSQTPNLPPEVQELIAALADWSALPDLSTPRMQTVLGRAIQQGLSPARLNALQALVFNDLAFSFYQAVEQAKIALSESGVTTLDLQQGALRLWYLYTRTQFERDTDFAYQQIEAALRDVLHDSGLTAEEVDVVVKTGGSSNVPRFTALLERTFGTAKVQASDIFGSVTAGLAICAREAHAI